jgi:uridine kinase
VELDSVCDELVTRSALSRVHALLVAISGIDGSGKGFVAKRLGDQLRAIGARVATINIDGWLNLPSVRFARTNPAEHFYGHAIRFEELFGDVVLPLKRDRSLRTVTRFVEETAVDYRPQLWQFDDVDIILLEGIYLLRADLRRHYDASIWIDCSFETALDRAIARRQEGLSEADTIRAYETTYFPAQRIHFDRDAPRAAAWRVVANDHRLPTSCRLL